MILSLQSKADKHAQKARRAVLAWENGREVLPILTDAVIEKNTTKPRQTNVGNGTYEDMKMIELSDINRMAHSTGFNLRRLNEELEVRNLKWKENIREAVSKPPISHPHNMAYVKSVLSAALEEDIIDPTNMKYLSSHLHAPLLSSNKLNDRYLI